ncbi:DUF418 domain-containing protein [Iodobacter fluviatilis]|uniref:Membrane protein YeiB n=1 Tax=Iodobacter fluviatilis TaxID=537 RepID=A0A377Q7A9_9NEIS|nr:DUF418 domain-containing protein [Iodobacter fluviatilis]TCU89433.1 putative membrane protein YeiB [Iodobacter fluviatilis]STQ90803.1 Predicted membrane protein [Iodobacter fluviatilis]
MKQRILGFDLARALAIFGMVIVNFKIVMHAQASENAAWLNIVNVIDGRASALFVILAGVGLSLLARQFSGDLVALAGVRKVLLKRAGFLFVLGLLYIEIWPADILHYYGMYILVGTLCLVLASRYIMALIVLLLIISTTLFVMLNYSTAWDWKTLSYADLWTIPGFIRHLLFNGFHPVLPWLGFLLLGMVIGRQNLSHVAIRERLFLLGLFAAVLAELIVLFLPYALLMGMPSAYGVFFSTVPMPPLPLYFIGAAGSAVVIITLCVALGEKFGQKSWLMPFVYTGQLGLTFYLAHVILGMGLLESLGMLENQSLAFSVSSALLFCVLAVVFASYWRKSFSQGPLENMLRRVSR